jgi:LmbE family N-acetylglucosaminyl deacetylase
MLRIKFQENRTHKYNLLFLGAHCDDIEIGCGGTILKIIDILKNVSVKWVVFSSDLYRKKEAFSSAGEFLKNVMEKEVRIEEFRNGFFPFHGEEIKEYFEKLKEGYSPDVIFTHYQVDLHQDHRLINELTWNTFRNHLILEYEIPKYDGDMGKPNFFVHLDAPTCSEKIRNIMKYFKTQSDKHWFSEDTFGAIMRLRGMESNAPSKYAEGYYCRKIVL